MTFAGYPAPFIRNRPDGAKIQQLIWGDFVTLRGEEDGDWIKVKSRRTEGWMLKADLQSERLLEIGFVDIGQGDGAFMVTPDDRFVLVDAGESDNMLRFLSWRFDLRHNPDRVIRIRQAVISHPDQDHYKGFAPLFQSTHFRFDAVYHNGIVERAGASLLGPRETHNGRQYLADIISDPAALAQFLTNPQTVGNKQYPKMLKAAIDSGRVTEIRGLSAADQFLPGHGAEQELKIEVLAPVAETVAGRPMLRWFGDTGPTKNGHSIVLRMVYRNVRILAGGDLNIPSEEYLLAHYTGLDPRPDTEAEREALVARARPIFEADVAKACHHGSADFTDVYLAAVNPLATVISSGDNEPHAHPRPDALGAYGRAGRGRRPLVFSTELARSTKENIKDPEKLRDALRDLIVKLQNATTPEKRAEIQGRIDEALAKLERSVAVYGLINVRTDGRRVLIAQKLERPRPQTREEWDVHRLEPGPDGSLRYVSRH